VRAYLAEVQNRRDLQLLACRRMKGKPLLSRLRAVANQRFDIDLKLYSHLPEARRPKLLRSYGIDTLIDVGANVGQYASDVRARGYTGRIVSFEPVGSAFAELERAATADPRWEAHRIAVTDEPGELTVNVSETTTQSSALPVLDSYVEIDPAAAVQGIETVPADTLDSLVAKHTGPDERIAIKIDVQGFETHVLDGGGDAIARTQILELEFLTIPSYEGAVLAPELLARVFGMGLRLALVENIMQEPSGASCAINGLFTRD
jgi:FkbM family methyltransferase